jgi:RHS repeat-associated protein
MPHLPRMKWDFRDRFQASARQRVKSDRPETTWYSYGDDGIRVRKTTMRQAKEGEEPTRKSERKYIGPFEIYREYESDGATVLMEKESLNVMNGSKRVTLIETLTQGRSSCGPLQLMRYQYVNHQSSSVLELDENAHIISYEEYYPYGSSSYQALHYQVEWPKRYRYIGRERDEESGLSYHGARYYATWLGRWTSCDPEALKPPDSPEKRPKPEGKSSDEDKENKRLKLLSNLYNYAFCNPVTFTDKNGRDPVPESLLTDLKWVPKDADEMAQALKYSANSLFQLFGTDNNVSHAATQATIEASVAEAQGMQFLNPLTGKVYNHGANLANSVNAVRNAMNLLSTRFTQLSKMGPDAIRAIQGIKDAIQPILDYAKRFLNIGDKAVQLLDRIRSNTAFAGRLANKTFEVGQTATQRLAGVGEKLLPEAEPLSQEAGALLNEAKQLAPEAEDTIREAAPLGAAASATFAAYSQAGAAAATGAGSQVTRFFGAAAEIFLSIGAGAESVFLMLFKFPGSKNEA